MTRGLIMRSLIFLAALGAANAYWLMGANIIVTERLDPIVNPGKVSGHVHSVVGGSAFSKNVTTAKLRQSQCTSVPIPQDHSNYWFPHLYFLWKNGSVSSVNGGVVIYYLFDDPPTQKAFPDDFRMISGDPTLRSYNASSYAQQAVTFLCLDFNGVTTKHNELPSGVCPSGVRSQINFPSCWDGKNLDSPDHKSHVAFLSGGPDSGTCTDPNFPVRLVRVFMEVYWDTGSWTPYINQAANSTQPFIFSTGDKTGYGYHADFYNGWEAGVLQNAINNCHCNEYGDPTCCAEAGIFDLNQGQQCHITQEVDEQTTGTLPKLPGNNPYTGYGPNAVMVADPNPPPFIEPVYAYTGNSPTATGTVVSSPSTTSSSTTTTSSSSSSSTTTSTSASSKTSTSSSTASGSSSTGTSSSGSTGGSNPPASTGGKSGSSTSTTSTSTSSNVGGSGGSGSSGPSTSTTSTSTSSTNAGGSGGSSSPGGSGGSSTSTSTSTSTSSNAGASGGSSTKSGGSSSTSGGYGSSPSSSSNGSSHSTSSSSPATTSSSTTTGSGSNSDPHSSPANGSTPASGTSEEDEGDGDEPTCTPRKKSRKSRKSQPKKSFSQHHARRRFHSSMMKI